MARYRDRRHAGRVLAAALSAYTGDPNVWVLALPRGGVPVAYEVARQLGAPLDVFVVRKLGLPGQEEFAMGALASGGARVLNRELVSALRIPERVIEEVTAREERELARRERVYRGARPAPELTGKTAILVDDGLATGASMRAAVQGLRQLGPARIVVAVPIAAPSTCAELSRMVDDIACAAMPEPFHSVGRWYADFSQISDAQVCALLATARRASQSDATRAHTARP